MMAWAKLKLEQWQAFADELGDPELEDIPTIVAISVDDFLDAAKTLNLKAVPKARINLAVNVARIKAGMPPIDMFTQVPEEATAAQMTRIEPAGRPEEATVTLVTLKVAHYFD